MFVAKPESLLKKMSAEELAREYDAAHAAYKKSGAGNALAYALICKGALAQRQKKDYEAQRSAAAQAAAERRQRITSLARSVTVALPGNSDAAELRRLLTEELGDAD